MYVWKATTVVFACATAWLGWPAEEATRRAPMERTFDAWDEAPILPAEPNVEISADIDVIAAMRAGDIDLAERSMLDTRPRVARAAIETLFRVGASDALISGLTERAPWWRTERIIRALGWIGDEVSVRTLLEMLQDDKPRMRHERVAIVDALGTTASPAVLPALRHFVEDGSDRDSLDRALAAVAYLATPEADRLLLSWTARPGQLGTLALARLDPESESARPILRDALRERDESRASSAAWAMYGSTALGEELLECARSRRDEGGNACLSVLAERGDPAVATLMETTQSPMYLALDLAVSEPGRALLRTIADSEVGETRISALVGLAQHDDRARGELVTAAMDLGIAHRVDLGSELLGIGVAEGTDILVDAVLSGAPRTMREEALRALASNTESGVDALRSLARNGEGAVAEQARIALLSRGTIDDADVDLLARALEDGNASILDRLNGELPARAERLLIDHVDDPQARHGAMRVLARQLPVAQALRLAGDDVGLQTMVLASSSGDDPSVDVAVGRIVDAQGLPYLTARLSRHDAVRRRLVDALDDEDDRLLALEHVGNELEPERLEGFLRDRDPAVRAAALEHLQNREGVVGARAGLTGIRDAEPDIRSQSIRTLRNALDPRAQRALVGAMHDPDENVAIEAASAVLQSVGGDAVHDVVAMALDPRVSEPLRRDLAQQVMNAGYELDEATTARLGELGGFGARHHPRVIQLDEF